MTNYRATQSQITADRLAKVPARIERAYAAFEAGFVTKSAQKDALTELNRAYEAIRDAFADSIRDGAPGQHKGSALTSAEWDVRGAYFAARETPFDLHQVRERHLTIFAAQAGFEGHAAFIRDLIALRADIKAAPINPVERKDNEAVVAVRAQIEDILALRKAQYGRALELGEIFGGLPVSVNWHYVQNQFGTIFPRCFFYLAGKLTPLNVLVAASQELERRKAS
jgi:hypothetical protein